MKYFIVVSCFILWSFKVRAQSDTLPVFHQNMLVNPENNLKYGTYNSAIHFNLFYLLRGTFLPNYERLIGSSGLSVATGLGLCKYDAIGQFYFDEGSRYYEIGTNITRLGTRLRPAFNVGLKYYFKGELGGTSLQMVYTSLRNTVYFDDFVTIGTISYPSDFYQLNYLSRELKLALGICSKGSSKVYIDYTIGLGFRFINYQHYKQLNSTNSSGIISQIDYLKTKGSNVTSWLFITFDLGRRF